MKPFSSFFTLLLSYFLLPLSSAVYFIQDLQASTLPVFNSELASWTSNTGSTLSGSSSGNFLLFSMGYSRSQVQKTYTGIDDHDYIAFSLGMYMESSCTGNILQLSFDGITTQMLVGNGLATPATGKFYIKGGIPHSGSTLTVTITSKLTSSCRSFRFGIRELSMNFVKNLETTEQQFCHTHLTTPQLSPVCECGPAQIEELPCASCSTGCLNCGGRIEGIETCSKCDSTKLLEWDGGSCSTCGSHCDKCTGKMGADCRSCLDEHFIYGNGTCIQGCASPFQQVSTGDLIDSCVVPCAADEWLFRDLSCKDSCPSYFAEVIDMNGLRWCKSPCDNEEDYFNEKEGTCEASCEYPNKAEDVGGIKTCSLNLDKDQTQQIEKTSKAVDGINSGSSGVIVAMSFLSSSDSSSILMGAFSKMLQYIKYMDIVYPAKVQLMLEMLNSNSTGGFASKIMRRELDKFPEHELPEKFEYYGALSNFFVNYWPSMFTLLVLFFVTVLVILFTSCLKSSVKVNQVLTQVAGRLKWNMILLLFCGDFGDIVFFTSLELTTAKLNSFVSVWSLLVCILMNIFAAWVMLKILSVNFNIRKEKQQGKDQEIENKWENYKTFFAIYKDQSYFQQIFLFIFIIRVSIFNAVIGYFFNYPLAQAILITLTNLTMLLYLIFKRPMKMLINFIQQVVLEGLLLIFNICLCLLAGLDHHGIEAYGFRDGIGEVMLVMNLIVPIVSIVILVIKILILGIEAYKEWKAEKAKQRNMEKRDIRIELPRKQQKIGSINGDHIVEASLQNKSNILDMSSSQVNFLNSSQPWINIHPNEQNIEPKNLKWNQTVSDFGIIDQSTSCSPYQQPYQANSHEMGQSDMQARKIVKKPRIKRNRTLKFNQSQVKNGEIGSVFEEA